MKRGRDGRRKGASGARYRVRDRGDYFDEWAAKPRKSLLLQSLHFKALRGHYVLRQNERLKGLLMAKDAENLESLISTLEALINQD